MAVRFDKEEGERQRDEATERVERAADLAWKMSAHGAVLWCCQLRGPGGEFSTDAVWWRLNSLDTLPPREPRAMGPVMTNARRMGLIEWTGRFTQTTRPGNHRGWIKIWRVL